MRRPYHRKTIISEQVSSSDACMVGKLLHPAVATIHGPAIGKTGAPTGFLQFAPRAAAFDPSSRSRSERLLNGAERKLMSVLVGFRFCPFCMDRLRFASEVVVSDRKSLICIRPVDRLTGRGLDGSTHAPLISLPDRLLSNH